MRRLLAAAVALGVVAGLGFGAAGLTILPFRTSLATGAVVVLPNDDRADVMLSGPYRGVYYDRVGSPSNVVVR